MSLPCDLLIYDPGQKNWDSRESWRIKKEKIIKIIKISTQKEHCSICSITSAGQKSRSVAVRWVLIVRDRARYRTIEQRPIDMMMLGCLNFFGQGKYLCTNTCTGLLRKSMTLSSTPLSSDNKRFCKRWRRPQILQFCGDSWHIKREPRPN